MEVSLSAQNTESNKLTEALSVKFTFSFLDLLV
jgi:hypothetical protein